MEDFVKEIYSSALSRSEGIASICSHYFGEENVDLQCNDFRTIYNQFKKVQLDTILNKGLLAGNNHLLGIYEDLLVGNASNRLLFTESNIELFKDYYRILLPSKFIEKLNASILIRIPETTIKNKLNETQKIYDLFFKINISNNNPDKIELNRTTFQKNHYYSSYMHSHANKDNFLRWATPCFGNGPIKTTLEACRTRGTEANIFSLCLEIERYAQIESLDGGPYIKMSQIRDSALVKKLHDITTEISLTQKYPKIKTIIDDKNFIKRIIVNKALNSFDINGFRLIGTEFRDASISITRQYLLHLKETMPYAEAYKRVTKEISSGIFIPYDVENGVVKKVDYAAADSSGRTDFDRNGRELFKFKDEMIKLKIMNKAEDLTHAPHILNQDIVLNIINTIYKLQIKTYANKSSKYKGRVYTI